MVASKTTPVCDECRHVVKSSTVDHDVVSRLHQVLDARDVATWNFDFATSTPLEGRYDWRLTGHAEATTAPNDWTADRDLLSARRRPTGNSSTRRRLVFDKRDLAAADRAMAAFLLNRLNPPRHYRETSEQCSQPKEAPHSELECPATSAPPAVRSFDDDQRTVPSDAANSRVRCSSSTERRTAASTMKRRRSAYENRSLRVSRITEYFVSKKRRETRDQLIALHERKRTN